MPTFRGAVRRGLAAAGLQTVNAADAEAARLHHRIDELKQRNQKLRTKVDRLQGDRNRTTAVPAIPGQDRLGLRREQVLAGVKPDALILEIGPAHNAILPKRDGYDVRIVDYLDREGLVKRYAGFSQYDPHDIEEVDYVFQPGTPWSEVIPERFDLIVASHVIEHTTSMIDFLNECEKLLEPDGVLALVIPDHRYCFDRFRERASLSRVIDASLYPSSVHTMGAVIEERLNAAKHGGITAWGPRHKGDYTFANGLETVKASGEEARRGERYIDTHNWVCTPNHLRLLLQDLADLDFISLRETSFHDTVKHEFFINLSPSGEGTGLAREDLLVLADDERRVLDQAVFEK
ncbi:methyltransferase domain-containing protein [Nocardioides sp. NPDC006273]|uniref:methyltransferase domain-containing protein n=1 Tax=Nocardioides sp. NPDC006273 TaxID=3155598 RepID=UPI0033AF18AC